MLKERDEYLDYLKGMAIFLVVLGHYFQSQSEYYDDDWRFKLIYSFHMPFFMFLSGVTVYVATGNFPGEKFNIGNYSQDIFKKAIRLIVPFFSWGVVSYYINAPGKESFFQYLNVLIRAPDMGLWFLPALFLSFIYLDLAGLLRITFQKWHPFKYKDLAVFLSMAVSYVVLMKTPNIFALGFTKNLYPYFCLGVFWGRYEKQLLPAVFSVIPFLLFVWLFGFFHRINLPIQFINYLQGHAIPVPNLIYTNLIYRFTIAVCGIYIILHLVKIFYSILNARIRSVIAYCGQRSLDLYATHLYFLGFFNGVIRVVFAIVGSLFVSYVMRKSDTLTALLYGQIKTKREIVK